MPCIESSVYTTGAECECDITERFLIFKIAEQAVVYDGKAAKAYNDKYEQVVDCS